jgi:hypothetical protein
MPSVVRTRGRPPIEPNASGVPTVALIGYARRLIARRFHIPSQDVDDVVAASVLDFLSVGCSGRPCRDGLFLIIAQRRACDFWRAYRAQLGLDAASRVGCMPNVSRLEERMIQRQLLRAAVGTRLDARRLLGITSRIFAGESFTEACRGIGVPRGSQGRYRQALRDLLERTSLRRGATARRRWPP